MPQQGVHLQFQGRELVDGDTISIGDSRRPVQHQTYGYLVRFFVAVW